MDDQGIGCNVERDDTHVYFAPAYSSDPAALRRVPIAGGPVETLATLSEIHDLAVGDSVIYVSTDTGVVSVPKTGGQPQTLDSPGWTDELFVTSGSLFYLQALAGVIWMMPLGGGTATEIAHDGGWISHIWVEDPFVYYYDRSGKRIARAPTSGTTAPEEITKTGTASGSGPVLDSTHAYWFAYHLVDQEGSVQRVPKAGGAAETLLQGSSPLAILRDGSSLLIADAPLGLDPNGSIQRLPAAGGQIETLATGIVRPAGLAVDNDYVYFCATDGVYRAPK